MYNMHKKTSKLEIIFSIFDIQKLKKDEILINCITKNNNFLTTKTKAKIINIF